MLLLPSHFFGYIISVLANVNSQFQNYESEFSQFFDHPTGLICLCVIVFVKNRTYLAHYAMSWESRIWVWKHWKVQNLSSCQKKLGQRSVQRLRDLLEKNVKKHSNIFKALVKGQIISKHFFPCRGFFQKTNENTSHTSKNKFIHSFFGRILGLTICFRH